MSIDAALTEWRSKKRRTGCVAATQWFCARVSGFEPKRLTRFTADGEVFEHVVAESTDGYVRIDLAPSFDSARTVDGKDTP
jgi:hypothetical protein